MEWLLGQSVGSPMASHRRQQKGCRWNRPGAKRPGETDKPPDRIAALLDEANLEVTDLATGVNVSRVKFLRQIRHRSGLVRGFTGSG